MSAQGEFARIAGDDGRAALVTRDRGRRARRASCSSAPTARPRAASATPELDRAAVEAAEELMWAERSELREVGDAKLFVDVTAPAPRLVIFGAVDYAAALCRLAQRRRAGGPSCATRARSSPPASASRTPRT